MTRKKIHTTRALRGLNGQNRLVTLENRYWNGLDWLLHDRNVSMDKILSYAWEIAVNKTDDELIYGECLMWAIFDYYQMHTALAYDIANDIWPATDTIYIPRAPQKDYPKKLKFPVVFYLLKFIARPEDCKAVIERKFWNS